MPQPRRVAPVVPSLTLATASGSHHSIFVRPGAKRVFVVFGSDAPSVAEASSKGPANIVRLTDEENHFSTGVPGFADSLDILFCWLRRLEQGLPITLVGQNAGANVAMAAALLLPRAKLVAFDPIIPDEEQALHPYWGDVMSLARNFPMRRDGIIGFSTWGQKAAAALALPDMVPSPFGTIIELPCPANAVGYLRQRGAFEALLHDGADALTELAESKVLCNARESGNLKQYGAFNMARHQVERGRSGRKEALRLIQSLAEWENPGWQHLRSRVLRGEGDLPAAVEAARRAAESGPAVVEFCVNFGKIVLEAEAGDQAEAAASLLERFVKQRGVKDLQSSLLEAAARPA